MKNIELIIDFDGTCVTHEWPAIGKDIGAVPVLKLLVSNGHRLILSTMRSNRPFRRGDGTLDERGLDNGVELYGIQTNPTQEQWTDSPKAYGQLHIDDASLGCPLIYPRDGGRPYVDWPMVETMLWEKGLFKFEPKVSPSEAFENFKNRGAIALKMYTTPYKLFLDDERMPNDVYNFMMAEQEGDDSNNDNYIKMIASNYENNDRWVIVRTYDEFVKFVTENGLPTTISFDHDLADFSGPDGEERTGMDCAKWIGNVYLEHNIKELFHWEVHSKNTVGAENINSYLWNLEKHL